MASLPVAKLVAIVTTRPEAATHQAHGKTEQKWRIQRRQRPSFLMTLLLLLFVLLLLLLLLLMLLLIVQTDHMATKKEIGLTALRFLSTSR